MYIARAEINWAGGEVSGKLEGVKARRRKNAEVYVEEYVFKETNWRDWQYFECRKFSRQDFAGFV